MPSRARTLAVTLDLRIETQRWASIPGLRARLQQAALAALSRLPSSMPSSCSFTLLLTGNAALRRLNRDFRGIDRPTNVLSFPQFDSALPSRRSAGSGPVFLGDIALGYQYIAEEARRDHKILKDHVTHLMIHGLFHLFGYDHMAEAEARRMERLEQKVMNDLGLPDPYRLPVPLDTPKRSARRKRRRPVNP